MVSPLKRFIYFFFYNSQDQKYKWGIPQPHLANSIPSAIFLPPTLQSVEETLKTREEDYNA